MKPIIAPTLCPGCLTELPDDYPYDHVRIDRALGDLALFRSMGQDERAEVIRAGLDRGMTLQQVATQVRRTQHDLLVILGGEGRSLEADRLQLEERIRELHARGLSDSDIALRLGKTAGGINHVRRRLGLPTLYGPGGRRIDHELVSA